MCFDSLSTFIIFASARYESGFCLPCTILIHFCMRSLMQIAGLAVNEAAVQLAFSDQTRARSVRKALERASRNAGALSLLDARGALAVLRALESFSLCLPSLYPASLVFRLSP